MTEPSPIPPPALPSEPRPLPFGLDAAEFAQLAELMAPASGRLGVDMRDFMARLERGESVASAFGLPAGTVEALYARAHALFAAGRHDRARAVFQALCTLDGADADYWVGYGICLHQGGAPPEAALAFATAAALRPDWAVPHYHAAQLALSAERWSTAAEHLDAFASRADGSLPAAMRREVERQRAALELRRRGASAAGTRAR